jgi:hypothetical protein
MMDPALYRKHLRDRLVQCHVPDHLHEGLVEYLADRRPTGRFLMAVLSNDLIEAATRADPFNRAHLADIVLFLLNYAPANSFGSEQRVSDWLASTSPVVGVME